MVKEPAFWSNPPSRPGLAARLLSPLGALYAGATARRVAQVGRHLSIPVISVGNLNAGGTGKTPTVIALIAHLTAMNRKPVVISRGYGGTIKTPTLVDLSTHAATQVGDEPLLLSAFAPVVVSPDRAAASDLAAQHGDVILLDDAHQNPGLVKDLSLVVVDAHRGFGNGRCIPAGPLREPEAKGLARADLVLSIGDATAQAKFAKNWGAQIATPRITGHLEPLNTGMPWAGLPCFAFAGIAHPEKFFATLRRQGAHILHAEALSDHQPLSPALLERLSRDAAAVHAQLVTTEKDAVRLPAEWRARVLTLPVRLQIQDPAPLDAALAQILV